MKKIVVTGGSGRFGSVLKKFKTKHKMFFPTKKELNILDLNNIKSYLKRKKPNILIHLAGLSRPMEEHERKIQKSIDLNIIGTANIVKGCVDNKIKLIYFSTNYVYPGKKGNYSETDPLNPVNNYAWSKLGGEASVRLFKNSLILRTCMTEKPFIHKKAFSNIKLNFIFHEDIAKILFQIIDKKGILNIGGKTRTVYDFAKKYNPNVEKAQSKKEFPPKPFMNLSKFYKTKKI